VPSSWSRPAISPETSGLLIARAHDELLAGNEDRRLDDVRPLVTSTVPLEGVAAAFEALGDPERECKVMVRP
jgi:threonine dehydrogenase-like Zn-dependent dehydrogenase